MSTSFWDNSTGPAVASLTGAPVVQSTSFGPGASGATYMANEWDSVALSGKQVPGLVDVYVYSKQRRVQNKKQNGSDGNTPTFRGLDPAKLTITVIIWTVDQLAKWDALLPVIFPNPNKDVNKLSAIDISHPATNQRGVKSIIVEDIDGPKPGPVHGSKIYSLKCFEYLPTKAKSAVKTVVAASATTAAFSAPVASKNNPPPPSQTDFGPQASFQPAGGSS